MLSTPLWLVFVVVWHIALCYQPNVEERVAHVNWVAEEFPAKSDMTGTQAYVRRKRTIWDFPIKRLLTGATRTGETLFDGRKYNKPEGFRKAQQDFRSLNLKHVQEVRDGLWIGRVQDKMVRLDKLYNNRARIQVYPDRFGTPPILSVEYDISKRPMDAFVDLCNLADNCHNP